MAKINFYVRSKQKKQPATIYLRFTEGSDIELWTPTPFKIYPKYWSNTTHSIKGSIISDNVFIEEDKNNLEDDLQELKTFVLKEYNELRKTTASPTKEWLNTSIDKLYKKDVQAPATMNQYIEKFIDEAEKGIRTTNKKRFMLQVQ
jgi:hypothetical protein